MAAKTIYALYRRPITDTRIDTTRAVIGELVRSHLSVFRAMVSFAARWNIGDAPVTVFFPLTMPGNTVYTISSFRDTEIFTTIDHNHCEFLPTLMIERLVTVPILQLRWHKNQWRNMQWDDNISYDGTER